MRLRRCAKVRPNQTQHEEIDATYTARNFSRNRIIAYGSHKSMQVSGVLAQYESRSFVYIEAERSRCKVWGVERIFREKKRIC